MSFFLLSVCLSLSVSPLRVPSGCLFVCLSSCVSVCLSLFVCLYLCACVLLSVSICPSVCRSLSPPPLSLCESFCLPIYLPVSFCLSISLSVSACLPPSPLCLSARRTVPFTFVSLWTTPMQSESNDHTTMEHSLLLTNPTPGSFPPAAEKVGA